MRSDYSYRFLTHHLSNIGGMGLAAVRNANPITRPSSLPTLPVMRQQRFAPVSDKLVDSYVQWSGAPATRYEDTLPIHFCSYWAMPLLAKLGGLAPYNLLSLLNQGLRLQQHLPQQRGDAIDLRGSLLDVREEPGRVRIHTQIKAYNAHGGHTVTLDSYSAVPQGKPQKKGPARAVTPMPVVGTWDALDNDGLNFAVLTGDFNPIHTIPAVGKRTRFKTLILHGFGQFARTYECLRDAGYSIEDIDIRWLKPLTLPNYRLQVQVAPLDDEPGWFAVQLMSSRDDLHMAGRFKGVKA